MVGDGIGILFPYFNGLKVLIEESFVVVYQFLGRSTMGCSSDPLSLCVV